MRFDSRLGPEPTSNMSIMHRFSWLRRLRFDLGLGVHSLKTDPQPCFYCARTMRFDLRFDSRCGPEPQTCRKFKGKKGWMEDGWMDEWMD